MVSELNYQPISRGETGEQEYTMQHPTRTIIATDYYRSKADDNERFPGPVLQSEKTFGPDAYLAYLNPDGTFWTAHRFSTDGEGTWERVVEGVGR